MVTLIEMLQTQLKLVVTLDYLVLGLLASNSVALLRNAKYKCAMIKLKIKANYNHYF